MKATEVRQAMRIVFLRGSRGFTLLEVMIAMVILAVSLLGLAGLQMVSLNSNSLASQITEATTFAQDQLERLITTPFANLSGGGGGNVTGATGVTYNVQWTVNPDPPVGSRANVTVTVQWTQDTNHTLSIQSVISQL